MAESSLIELLQQHPIICAGPFCQWAGVNPAAPQPEHLQRLYQACRQLLSLLTTLQRATYGGHYGGLAQFLVRADINAAGLLGNQAGAAYAWLRVSWRQPTPPPAVVQAWKVGMGQLICWLRQRGRQPPELPIRLTSTTLFTFHSY